MIYEKSSAIGHDGLLDAIKAFVETNGWTVNHHASEGDGKRLHVSKGALHFSMRSHDANPHSYKINSPYDYAISGLSISGCTGYASGSAWDEQPGAAKQVYNSVTMTARAHRIFNNTVTYWFFLYTNPDAFYCIVETAPDKYTWLMFGELEKTAAWTGGAFFGAQRSRLIADTNVANYDYGMFEGEHSGSYQPCYIRADVDAFSGWLGVPDLTATYQNTGLGWISSVPQGILSPSGTPLTNHYRLNRVPNFSYFGDGGGSDYYMAGTISAMYTPEWDRSIFLPIMLYVHRNDGGNFFSMLGRLPHVYFADAYSTEIDTVLTVGATNFRVLPQYSKFSYYTDNGERLPMSGIAFKVN